MPRTYNSQEFKRKYATDPIYRDKMLTRAKLRYLNNRDVIRTQARESAREIRRIAIQVYGAVCVRCGSDTYLEFDHVNGDGGRHREREGPNAMYRRIAKSKRKLSDVELQLLCHFCHKYKEFSVEEVRSKLDRLMLSLFTMDEFIRRNS